MVASQRRSWTDRGLSRSRLAALSGTIHTGVLGRVDWLGTMILDFIVQVLDRPRSAADWRCAGCFCPSTRHPGLIHLAHHGAICRNRISSSDLSGWLVQPVAAGGGPLPRGYARSEMVRTAWAGVSCRGAASCARWHGVAGSRDCRTRPLVDGGDLPGPRRPPAARRRMCAFSG
jgi:hypothetical protein